MLSLSHALLLVLAGSGLGAVVAPPSPASGASAASAAACTPPPPPLPYTHTRCTAKGSPAAPVTTPQPAQPGMVANCRAFYLVRAGDTCGSVAAANNLTVARFQRWNAATGPDCTALLADHYACVAVADDPPPAPTPTTSPAPVQTPSPIQPGMVANCRSFHYVEPGQACAAIQIRYGISFRDLVRWNPDIGSGCTNMWAYTWLCVAVA